MSFYQIVIIEMEISFEFMMQSHTAFLNAKWFSLRYYAASTNSESLFFFVKYDEREMVIHNWNHFAQTHCSQPLSFYRRRPFVYTTHTQTVSHFFKHSACCWVSECECIFFSLRPQYQCRWLCSVSQPLIRCFSFFRLFKCLIRLFTLCLL